MNKSMKMHVVTCMTFIILTYACASAVDHYRCGPQSECSCVSKTSAIAMNVTMDCSGKDLSNLSEICEYLDNATCLDASSNNITGILDGSDVLGCEDLLSLSLRNNTVTNITRNVFKKLQNLQDLDISNNTWHLYAGNSNFTFADLVNLETLKINGNPVNYSATSPRYPDLTANKHLTSLYTDGLRNDNRPFPALTSLSTLVISGFEGTCDIHKLDDTFFKDLHQLETLDLSFCDIYQVSLNAFSSLQNLRWLNIAHNRRLGLGPLFNISHGLQFSKIEYINMSYVYSTFGLGIQITKHDLCYLRNTSLREIVLDGDRLELIETNALQLFPPSLQRIHISDNHFTFGPYLLQAPCASGIKEFYANFQNSYHNPLLYSNEPNSPEEQIIYTTDCPFMKDEYLRNISNNIPDCKFYEKNETVVISLPSIPPNVTKVQFHDCNMKYNLPSIVFTPLLNKIEYLDGSGNIFQTWGKPDGPLYKLKHLDLSRNYCSKIENKFFEYITELENLQIHSNFIGLSLSNNKFNDVFHNLTSLKIMNMTMNKITSLHPKTLSGLASLETLDLSGNSINDWTLEVDTLTNLLHVNLTNNAMQSLPVSLMNHLLVISRYRKKNFTINLSQNTLKYGCQTKEFLLWMINHKKSFVGLKKYIIVDDNGDRIAIDDLEPKVHELKKNCQSYVIWIVTSSIGVSVALSVIIGGFIYRSRWKLRYFMYMSKQRFYGYMKVPNEDQVETYRFDAFISHADESSSFVTNQILPRLEQDGVSLCIHQRDFLPGKPIADNILDAIGASRKTVVLLTKDFLESKWCRYEFHMARMEHIYSREGRGCLVLVLLEHVPLAAMLPELKNFMTTESYIEYTTDPEGEIVFWNNLAQAIK